MSDKPTGFIVCRRGSDPLKSGYVRGYQCAICKKELQVSPTAIARLKETDIKLLMLCNPCGFEMVERLNEAGKPLEVEYTPDFLRSFSSYVAGKGVE
jgi:transcription elongation factor Elf1